MGVALGVGETVIVKLGVELSVGVGVGTQRSSLQSSTPTTKPRFKSEPSQFEESELEIV